MKRFYRYGFSLVEVLVVVVIIGVLATILVPNLTLALRKSQMVRSQAKITSLDAAIKSYRADVGRYPDQGRLIDQLTSRAAVNTTRWQGPYLADIGEEDIRTRTDIPASRITIVDDHGREDDRLGIVQGEPGYSDGFKRRLIYIPFTAYSQTFDNLSQDANGVRVPFFAARRPGDLVPGGISETPFETPFGGPDQRYWNYESFQLIGAGHDGKVYVGDNNHIVPLIWNNKINDDEHIDADQPDTAVDELFRGGYLLEDDAVNW